MSSSLIEKEEAAKLTLRRWAKWILAISILYFLWIGVVFLTVFTFGMSYNWAVLTFDLWVYIGLGLFGFFIIVELILLVYYWSIMQEREAKLPLFKPITEEAPGAVEGKKTYTYTFPKQTEGGIYSSIYVSVSDDMVLRLRQLLTRVCILCGKRLECWPHYKETVTRAEFLLNAGCLEELDKLSKRKKKVKKKKK